jgi:hypothetical protein
VVPGRAPLGVPDHRPRHDDHLPAHCALGRAGGLEQLSEPGRGRRRGGRARTDDSPESRGERAAHAIYGSIVVLAVIVAEQDTSIEAGEVIASVIGVAFVTAFAELYADYIGGTIRAARHPTGAERDIAFRNVAIGFLTAIVPVVYFILAAAGAMRLEVAFDAAVWTGVAVLGGYAVVANRLAGFSWQRSLLIGLGFTGLGAGLVLLKVLT